MAVAGERGSTSRAILYGGLAVGVLDILSAIIFWKLYRDVAPMRVLHSVAGGLLGRDAATQGGTQTALLGLALHFFISFIVATVYVLASTKLPALRRQWIFYGMAYGLVVFVVMNYVVIPFSAIGSWPRFQLPNLLFGVLGHFFLVGLPAAYFVRR